MWFILNLVWHRKLADPVERDNTGWELESPQIENFFWASPERTNSGSEVSLHSSANSMNSKSMQSVNSKPSATDSTPITVEGNQMKKIEKPKRSRPSAELSKTKNRTAKHSSKKCSRKKNSMHENQSSVALTVNNTLADTLNSSLRWGLELDDPVAEEERIRNYKRNRQQRYIEHAQLKLNLAWCSWRSHLQEFMNCTMLTSSLLCELLIESSFFLKSNFQLDIDEGVYELGIVKDNLFFILQ